MSETKTPEQVVSEKRAKFLDKLHKECRKEPTEGTISSHKDITRMVNELYNMPLDGTELFTEERVEKVHQIANECTGDLALTEYLWAMPASDIFIEFARLKDACRSEAEVEMLAHVFIPVLDGKLTDWDIAKSA